MGTRFELVVASADPLAARSAVDEAIYVIEELHRRLTRFSRDSLVAHINRSASTIPVRLDRATFHLLETAEAVRALSHGAFDITLGSGRLFLDHRACAVHFEGGATQIDLGAIAKGFALDCAADILREAGVSSALLHGGTSSVLAIGTPPDAPAWRVGIAHTRHLSHVDLNNSSISVSRSHAQLRAGEAHIRDPRTGAALSAHTLAVVTGPSAMLADAWSTALAVASQPGMPPHYWCHVETLAAS